MADMVEFQAAFTVGGIKVFGKKILSQLQTRADLRGDIDWEVHRADSKVIRAHQHSARAKGGRKLKH